MFGSGVIDCFRRLNMHTLIVGIKFSHDFLGSADIIGEVTGPDSVFHETG